MRGLVSIILSLCLLSAPAWAAAGSKGQWGAHLGAHLGYGHEGDDTTSFYTSRSVGTLDLQAMPGYRLYGGSILAGLLFDARLLSQLSNASEAAIGNLGGSGLTIGPGMAFEFTFGKLLLSWDWRDRHGISVPENTTLKGSGFHFLFGFHLTPGFTVDLEYVMSRYNTRSQNGVETDISDHPIKHSNIGAGVSLSL